MQIDHWMQAIRQRLDLMRIMNVFLSGQLKK
jgi:hypothetical protein